MLLRHLTQFSLDRPKTVIVGILLITLFFMTQFLKITIDTDPENMLETNQPDRVFYDGTKNTFGINDMIVIGIVDEDGIFRTEALAPIARAIDAIVRIKGVIIEDVISMTTTNNVKSAGGLLDIHQLAMR